MKARLSVNTGFAVNRYTDPKQWIPYFKNELNVDAVQYTADMLSNLVGNELGLDIAKETRKIADEEELEIRSVFTGAFTRLNHFSHSDDRVREYWLSWFKAFVDVAKVLGAESLGSHFGIQSVLDYGDKACREKLFEENVKCWREIAAYAKRQGLKFLTWEPMSVGREYGETIAEVERIHQAVSGFDLPMLLCLDVDHGDADSGNPDDVNPYMYLKKFAQISPIVHLKQSRSDLNGHWPFTPEHNQMGKIIPSDVIGALESGGAEDVDFVLELSFKERSPIEKNITKSVLESVDYWKPYCEV